MRPRRTRPITLGGAVGLLLGESLLAFGAVVISLFLKGGLNVPLEVAAGLLLATAALLTWGGRQPGWWLAVALQAVLSVVALKQLSLAVLFTVVGLALLLVPATRKFVFEGPRNMLDQ